MGFNKPGFGKPKLSGGGNFKKAGSVKKGDNVRRLMPPMNGLADSGEWSVYITTHWGYHGTNPREPGKTIPRPFRCIKVFDRQTKMVRQECPKCTEMMGVEAQKKDQEAQLRSAKRSEAEIATALQPINDWLKAHNRESKHFVHTMLPDRSFEPFKLNNKDHMTQLRAKIKELMAAGIDPFDLDQGVWFNIKRLGDGAKVPDSVDIVTEPIPGVVGGQQVKLAPLTADEADRALKECRDLTDMGGQVLTFDQIAALVASDGSPEAVDAIMGSNRNEASPATPAAKFTPPKPVTPPAGTALYSGPLQSVPPVDEYGPEQVNPALPPSAVDTKALMEKRMADIAAKKAAEQAAVAAAAQPTPAFNPLELDDEAFMAFMSTQGAANAT